MPDSSASTDFREGINSTPLNLLFVTLADNTIGYGHVNRCLSLAQHAASHRSTAQFLLFGTEDAAARIKAAGYSCCLRPLSALGNADIAWSLSLADAVVCDLVHAAFFLDVRAPLELFKNLRSFGRLVVAIDSLGEQSLMAQAPEVEVDYMVIPYANAGANRKSGHFRVLCGAEYAVLSPAYADLLPRVLRPKADRVLVTCGGSDPRASTVTVLLGLELLPQRLKVRIIVGPLFSANLREQIHALASKSRHEVAFISAPHCLLDEMLGCDVAIASSGLTKYELAATGTPALLFSIDDMHDKANKPFAALGSCVDLGVSMSPEWVCKEISSLLDDIGKRKAMSVAGKNAVDGLGAQRLISEIGKELSC